MNDVKVSNFGDFWGDTRNSLESRAPVLEVIYLPLEIHAPELSNTSIVDRIQELKVASELLPEYEYHCRKEGILRAFQRTPPGNRGTQLVIKHNNQITADPALMADALKDHWGRVFAS